MAVRGYVAHEDMEGRSHLDRVRLLDRTHLVGAFGANMAIVDDSATPEEAYRALMADPANKANLKRSRRPSPMSKKGQKLPSIPAKTD